MHNLLLGTAKHVLDVWKENGLLTPLQLEVIQNKIDSMQVPAHIVRMPCFGEHLPVRSEMGNNHDKYAVSVVRQGGIIAHVPRQLSRTVWHFL